MALKWGQLLIRAIPFEIMMGGTKNKNVRVGP